MTDRLDEIRARCEAPDPPGITTIDPGCVPYLLSHIDRLERALMLAQIALNDWTVSYAPDMCSDEDVAETRERMSSGTLYHIADVQARIDKIMKEEVTDET